jgi:hypothetical protein
MLLVRQGASFAASPYLTTAISDNLFNTLDLNYFDKDGYEVPALLEQEYYRTNGVDLDNRIQYHVAPVHEWFRDDNRSSKGLVLDHCMLLTRWAFAGEARKQLESAVSDRPILNKLLGIKPKWGIDFSLDWIDQDACVEVIHIEQDFDSFYNATNTRRTLEHLIEDTVWVEGAKQLIQQRSEWEGLSSDDQSDYKARFFGWHRAFDNLKVF